MTQCKHPARLIKSGPVFPMSGECPAPGCHASFGRIGETCGRCGATRVLCQGTGAASHQAHVAAGYSRWRPREEEEWR